MPSKRREIVLRWAEVLPSELNDSDRKILRRIERIFPEEFEEVQSLRSAARQGAFRARVVAGMIAAETEHNFRGIPKEVYFEAPWWKEFGPRIVAAFRAACRQRADREPTWVFGNAHDMSRDIGMPLGRMCLVEFKEELDAIRLATAPRLSVEQFLKLFGGKPGTPGAARRTTIGHSKHGVESEVSRALRRYVNVRWREMSSSSE